MSGTTDTPTLVQAVYSFKGKNNDELCFKKGDIITLTQKEEGGWWEGTLGEKTGWFPSNYVKEYKPQDGGSPTTSKMSPSKLPPEIVAQQKAYRNLVLKDLIDSEKANVAELQGLLKNFLHPLEKSEILTKEEYRQLVGNIGCVVETHQQLLAALEECSQRPAPEQRVGRVFLSSAPRVKQVHQSYCASHPRAVCILDKYKDDLNTFMEAQGAASPGLLVLTTGLSKPFRRLEKYAGMLQELERHVEENHPDRGDTQRSVSVYKDIASACSATRRQKELELEVLTGGVRGWEGEDLSCLGDILHMGSVAVGPEHRDRYLVLFPSTLLILSVSQRMSAFIYEGKLPLTAITINKLEDTDVLKNAFEISGPMIERIVAVCQTREDQQLWVDQLRQQIRMLKKSSSVSSPPPVSPPASKPTPLPSPHVSVLLCPYSRLAAHFAGLVKQGVITRKVLKKLLYSVFTEGVNLSNVRLRRHHKVECKIIPHRVSVGTSTAHLTWVESCSSSATASGTSGTASSHGWKSGILVRQDAVDHTNEDQISSCASGPCGLICFYDSGSFDETPVVQKSVSVFGEIRNNSSEKTEERDASQTGRKSARYRSGTTVQLELKNKLLLAASEQSAESSSFERTSAHKSFPCDVCEDLSNLKDDVPIIKKKTSKQNVNNPDLRQSMPTPRRCCSTIQLSLHSLPSHVSAQEIALGTQLFDEGALHNSPPKTHSSTFDIPAMIPAPSALMAELLYNTDFETSQKEEDLSGKRLSHDKYPGSPALARKHTSQQCISDHKKSRLRPGRGRKMRGLPSDGSLPLHKTSSHSSSCHHSNSNVSTDSAANPNDSSCLLCRGDMPCSSRSSDSGLADIAGNSILPSPDLSSIHPDMARSESCPRTIGSFGLPHSLTLRESSEVDESNFEAQCICSSPFGSTPRTSAQPSLTSRKVFVGSSDSATQSVMSLSLSPSPVSTSQSHSSDPAIEENDNVSTFRSGMYAHWWLKARIPASALTSHQGTVCSCHSCCSCTEECSCGSTCITSCECPSCEQQSSASRNTPR